MCNRKYAHSIHSKPEGRNKVRSVKMIQYITKISLEGRRKFVGAFTLGHSHKAKQQSHIALPKLSHSYRLVK